MANLLNDNTAWERVGTIKTLIEEWSKLTEEQKEILEDWNIDTECMEWHLESVRDVYERIWNRSERLLAQLAKEGE